MYVHCNFFCEITMYWLIVFLQSYVNFHKFESRDFVKRKTILYIYYKLGIFTSITVDIVHRDVSINSLTLK